MKTSTTYRLKEKDKSILRVLCIYSLGRVDQLVEQGEKAPYLAIRHGIGEILNKLDEEGNIVLDDSERTSLNFVLCLIPFRLRHGKKLMQSAWTGNERFGSEFALSGFRSKDIICMVWNLRHGINEVTSYHIYEEDCE